MNLGHQTSVVAVAFAPAQFSVGKQSEQSGSDCTHTSSPQAVLATADSEGGVTVWCVPGGTCVCKLRASSRTEKIPVVSLIWGKVCVNGEARLVATSENGDAALWRFARDGNDTTISVVGEHRVVCGDETSTYMDRQSDTQQQQRDTDTDKQSETKHKPTPAVANFDASSALLAVGDFSGRLNVFDASDGSLRRASRRTHAGPITCVAMHQQGWQAVTGSTDGDGRCWDLEGMTGVKPGACQHTLRWGTPGSTKVTHVEYAPCGRLVVVVTSDHMGNAGSGAYRLLTWSVVTGRLCTWHDAHQGPVASLAWEVGFGSSGSSHDGSETNDEKENLPLSVLTQKLAKKRLQENVVVTASLDGALRLWALRGAPQGTHCAFPKSKHCFKPRSRRPRPSLKGSALLVTLTNTRGSYKYITSALFGPNTTTVFRLSRVITQTSHGKTDPFLSQSQKARGNRFTSAGSTRRARSCLARS
jgi:WD40 repeat protein